MAIDTPAKIVVIGAGPIGLEAALYARFLGYEIELFERGDVAERFRDSETTMATPFSINSTPLALAAMEAQGVDHLPSADAVLTDRDFAEQYLIPLAATDLLRSEIRTHCNVVAVGRRSSASDMEAEVANDGGVEDDDESAFDENDFVVTYQNDDGSEMITSARIVVDASGPDSQTNDSKSFLQNLQVGRCDRTGTYLGSQTGFEAIDTNNIQAADLITDEPNVYVIGDKSFGWGYDFELQFGHQQIQTLFAILGDRADLNLYSSIHPLGN